jgi:hypothetical protein
VTTLPAPRARFARSASALTLAIAAVSLSLVAASPAQAITPSITACSFSDGTTETSTFRVEQPSDVEMGSGPNLTMAVQDSAGYFWSENGFVNRSTGEFVFQGGGMRSPAADISTYAPPADLAYWIATQRFGEYYQSIGYTLDDWFYEFRYYASSAYGTGTGGQNVDPSIAPLCVVTIDLSTPSDITVVGGDGGTVDADLSTAGPGDTVTLTATPNPGYEFASWECTSGDVADPTSATTTVSNITADTTCTATFAAIGSGSESEALAETGPIEPALTTALLASGMLLAGLGAATLLAARRRVTSVVR